MHVFRRNKWRANNGKAGDKHLNFIKPSMVDATGVPMFGRTPFMDNNSAVYNPASISFGYQTVNGLTPIIDQGLQNTSKQGGNTYKFGAVFGNDSGYTFNDDGYQFSQVSTQPLGGLLYDSTSWGAGTNNIAIAGRNSTHVHSVTGAAKAQVNDQLMWKNTLVARGNNLGATEATYPWLPCATYSPALWPDYQPCTLSGEVDDYEVDSIIGKTKVSEYMKYLANVRSLPIGVSGYLAGTDYATPSVVMPAATNPGVNAFNCSFTEYRVSMPFLSGIYGILADKMFPDLLIGANNIRIEFKLASNNKALWLTMDPCRRVPGTVRDFAPFTGASNGNRRFGQSLTSFNFLSASLDTAGTALYPTGAALGCTNAMLYSGFTTDATGLLANTAACVYAPNPTSGVIVPGSYIYNTSSAMGEDLVAAQAAIDRVDGLLSTSSETVTFTLAVNGILTVTDVSADTFAIESGMALTITPTGGFNQGEAIWLTILSQADGTIGGAGDYVTDIVGSTLTSTTTALRLPNSSYIAHSNANLSGYSLGVYTNLPKPQYMPTATPWSQKTVGTLAAPTIASYCNENAACYGTYLPASVPQTRRCQVSSRLSISDANFSANGATAFAIRDLQYIGEQVQLDDISTSAIIQHAATSEIVVWTRGYRSFEANCDTGTQQNIILPIQVRALPLRHMTYNPLFCCAKH